MPRGQKEEMQSETMEQEQQTTTKSVVDFDRDEVATYETKTVSDMSSEDLLKVVIRRGEMDKNPALSGGCERVLRQINRERLGMRPTGPRVGPRPFFRQPSRFNQSGDFNRQSNFNRQGDDNEQQGQGQRRFSNFRGGFGRGRGGGRFQQPRRSEQPSQEQD